MKTKIIIHRKSADCNYLITQTGKLEYGRYPEGSLDVCLTGEKLHPAQFGRLRELLSALKIVFGDLEISGDFDYKKILGL